MSGAGNVFSSGNDLNNFNSALASGLSIQELGPTFSGAKLLYKFVCISVAHSQTFFCWLKSFKITLIEQLMCKKNISMLNIFPSFTFLVINIQLVNQARG